MSEKMIFCLGDGNYESKGEGYQKNNRIFNVDVTPDEFDTAKNAMPNFKLPIAKWVEYKDLDKDDQTTTSKQLGGLLKTLSYKDAWKEAKMSDVFKKWVKELPNFNAEIFEKITGLKWADDSLSGQTVEVKVGGKTYKAVIL